MLNPEILPLLALLIENHDLIDGYVFHVSYSNNYSDNLIFDKNHQNSKNKLNHNNPENVLLRLKSITNLIESHLTKFDKISETCLEQSKIILDEGYTYENYKFDRIRLRSEMKSNIISAIEFQKALNANILKCITTTQTIKTAFKPFFDNVYTYFEKNLQKDISHLPNYQNVFFLNNTPLS
ncbi:MAG: hypothetical protein RO257_14655 [Candidatus Kapabacteria bacterium]|nr:hypothetical protein [Candidatus Kapabacteria bacterium]